MSCKHCTAGGEPTSFLRAIFVFPPLVAWQRRQPICAQALVRAAGATRPTASSIVWTWVHVRAPIAGTSIASSMNTW